MKLEMGVIPDIEKVREVRKSKEEKRSQEETKRKEKLAESRADIIRYLGEALRFKTNNALLDGRSSAEMLRYKDCGEYIQEVHDIICEPEEIFEIMDAIASGLAEEYKQAGYEASVDKYNSSSGAYHNNDFYRLIIDF